jgi:glutamate dehydrogenase
MNRLGKFWGPPMSTDDGKVRAELLARAGQLASRDESLSNFLTHLVEALDPGDFIHIDAEGFEAAARISHARLKSHRKSHHTVVIWGDEDTRASNCEVIDIFNNNMPFLVDSSLAGIRAHGGEVLLFAHPLLPVTRADGTIKVLSKEARGVEGTEIVSFLHVIIAPIGPETKAALEAELDDILTQVRRMVRDWRPMLERLGEVVRAYRDTPPKVNQTKLAEAMQFLAWLADHNFTFVGMREYRLDTTKSEPALTPVSSSGLGILEDPDLKYLRQGAEYVDMTEQHMAFLKTDEPIMVAKANLRSKVHRRSHLDFVVVKIYDKDGTPCGELRVLGLFTSMSLATPHTDVPLIRSKISEVMRRSGQAAGSHTGKALMYALDNYPRDELFQIPVNDLIEFASVIAALPDRPRVRVLPRIDPFDNFVSVLLFAPRDRYDSNLRARVGAYLAEQYDGRVSAYYPHFPEGELVRVHYIIGRNGGVTPRPDREKLEIDIAAFSRTFGDRLADAAATPGDISGYADAFSSAYQEAYSHTDALADIAAFRTLNDDSALALKVSRRRGETLSLKLYHLHTPVPLSARVPILENFGFKVINERSYSVSPRDGIERILHDMTLECPDVGLNQLEPLFDLIEAALLAVWYNQADDDGFNRLTIAAGLGWDDVAILRALGRYLRQIGIPYSQAYLWNSLTAWPVVARALIALFYARHDPEFEGDRQKTEAQARTAIDQALDEITSIDDDRIVRRLLNLVEVSLRTNFYQRPDGQRRPALAIKFDAPLVDGMPKPRPYREIFVYCPRLEGIHLRGGPIARGGLRWSDRPEDFRTEILGLVKAQMVKNAVIVPLGAKGGFVPKKIPPSPSREVFFAEGTACYRIFIGSLLDITDNLDGDTVIPPKSVIRLDGDDPYLVVAADKGTATFSDTANAISNERGFWLSDAFASGGSAGYDHKKMGITARGGWEAVKRHFREMDHDIQSMPFTTVGVGDMSGDVFGNGMLLSQKTRLIAAFDHRDIFIDPDPDPAPSFAERKRLFEVGRSSWQDYDPSKLSDGGGIYSRRAKTIDLSPRARTVLGLGEGPLTANQIMIAILKANVDLLWFGGIGTYVRATSESDADAGDRANDALRITGNQIGAKVVGEGANLGLTQLARIEFDQAGGRINTDAIDNSAGVNSSDLEVNIKIAMGTLMRAGKMDIEQRNVFLASMTDEVAELCLRNNYLQSLAISLAQRRSARDLPFYGAMMSAFEASGDLDRTVEFLPDDGELAAREEAGQGLTRPELSVLLAYAKNLLFAELVTSNVPDVPYLAKELDRYFPPTLNETYPDTVHNHRLRREVIATVLSNAMINRGGPALVYQLSAATGATAAQIASAYAIARDAFELTGINAEIDTLDNEVLGGTQIELYEEVRTLLFAQTTWFLRNADFSRGIASLVEQYCAGVKAVRETLADLLPPFLAKAVADQAKGFEEGGTPAPLARRIAELSVLTLATDITAIAERSTMSVKDAARAYFAMLETFSLGRILELGDTVSVADYYDRMALGRAVANMMRAQRELTLDVLKDGEQSVKAAFKQWRDTRKDEIERTQSMVVDILEGQLTVSRLSVAAGLLSDLSRS